MKKCKIRLLYKLSRFLIIFNPYRQKTENLSEIFNKDIYQTEKFVLVQQKLEKPFVR